MACSPGLAAEHLGGASSWQRQREECLERPRRLIFNNDENEPVYYCNAATAEELLRSRTTPLAGSQVSSIFYCTWSSGFGLFTHHTKVGQLFATREAMFSKNRTEEFFQKHIDPLSVMAVFAHSNHMELFWSMRMNDTHDASSAEYGPVMFRANRLKQEHPQWLIGSREHRPKYGTWSAVDYGVPEIRNLAFRYCEEVCRNYDVDGIELDFMRHAFFFKCSDSGNPCGDVELNQMTDLVRRIRAMTEDVGKKRQRPILLAVRVPDSTEYCRYIGLDLERWLAEHRLDLLVAGGYTQLNPCEYSAALGHKYGVKVYPSLDEPRVRDADARKLRATVETYRGRGLSAWHAGADGIYMFNFFDPISPLWRELGEPGLLKNRDRNYFASVLGVGAMPVPHQKFIHISTLNPANPIPVSLEDSTNHVRASPITFTIGEDFISGAAPAQTTLHLRFNEPVASVRVAVNGTVLGPGNQTQGWVDFPLAPSLLHAGTNALTCKSVQNKTDKLLLLDLYTSVRAR
jgi:hypothetical protein